MKINTKFNLNDKIFIKELKIWGKVLSIFLGSRGIEYNIRYFNDFKANECYFLEDELSDKEDNCKIGYLDQK